MTYIARRLLVQDEERIQTVYSEDDFFSLEKPLVVLGEPGSGKTTLVDNLGKKFDSKSYPAASISVIQSVKFPQKIIIDGIDEITAYEENSSILRVLEKLPDHEKPNFILTCRSMEWKHNLFARSISERWKVKPVIGMLLPFNEQEIIDFVNNHPYRGQVDGKQFVYQAKQRGALDFLTNPQLLDMFLKTFHKKGWPDNRLMLFDNLCKMLIQEHNPIYDELYDTRPSDECLIEAAGFICAQLLLAGLNGLESSQFNNLSNEQFDLPLIRAVLSTKVFRNAEPRFLVPCHRTVAEFLAAKWLIKALQNKLSLRRLEELLYGNAYIVPSALRGLHGWIATLSPTEEKLQFIERDPYGVYKYGDITTFHQTELKALLFGLEKVAEDDPLFFFEGSNLDFTPSLAKFELKEDLERLLKNPSTPTQLLFLIIKALQNSSYIAEFSELLSQLAWNNSLDTSVRSLAVYILLQSETEVDWNLFVQKIISLADVFSYQIALTIIKQKLDQFTGKDIANLLIKIAESSNPTFPDYYFPHISEFDKNMSTQQLDDTLDALSAYQAEFKPTHQQKLSSVEKWILRLVEERLLRKPLVEASTIWVWSRDIVKNNYYNFRSDEFKQFFFKNPKLRCAVQYEAFKSEKEDGLNWLFFKLQRSPFQFEEDDIIFHLTQIIEDIDCPKNLLHWKQLANLAKLQSFSDAYVLVKEQAACHPILNQQLIELEESHLCDNEQVLNSEKEYYAKQAEYTEKIEQDAQIRHQSYLKNQEHVSKDISQLYTLSRIYLGEFSDNDPTTKSLFNFVGSELADEALHWIKNWVEREKPPSVGDIIQCAAENKEHLWEPILRAYCKILIDEAKPEAKPLEAINHSILTSALAACRDGGIIWNGKELIGPIQTELERIVFSNSEMKKKFLKDTMEPYLDKVSSVPNLHRLYSDKLFFDISGELSFEWLIKYEIFLPQTLKILLKTAAIYPKDNKLILIIRKNTQFFVEKKDKKEQFEIWLGYAFLLDFQHHQALLSSHTQKEKEFFWTIIEIAFPADLARLKYWPKLTEEQNYFLIANFAPQWVFIEQPLHAWTGHKNPWDATQYILGRITDLGCSSSDLAGEYLDKLLTLDELASYRDNLKHASREHKHGQASKNKKEYTLEDVRVILSSGAPKNHADLIAIFLDEFELLQKRIKNGSTNTYNSFWNGDKPRLEHLSRNCLVDLLEPELRRYGIRVVIEVAMPENKRCDVLISHQQMDIPIEIKGQWNEEVWTAALDQLPHYTRDYHAARKGIYIVFWFGYLGANQAHNPHGWKDQKLPKTAEEMRNLLSLKYKEISEDVKILVLDVSKETSLSE